jgi:sugar (pentulose or hexulose) kinase
MWSSPGIRKLVWAGLIAAALGACALEPPVQEMSDARQAIAAAEAAGADRFARDEISEARRFIQEAEEDITEESFGLARSKALRAQDRAVRALQTARAAAPDE